jgi:6-pyruvoyltetrahydropterin/6-carboxytetrahydropterin synthase
MTSITKIFTFAAAHHLPDYEGKCKAVHGHTFRLFVTVGLRPNRQGFSEGMIMDFAEVKNIVEGHVLCLLDHNDLNNTIKNPTAENIIEWIKDVLESVFSVKNVYLKKLQLWENDTSYAEWIKDDNPSD